MLKIMVELLQSSTTACAYIFVNFVSETSKWANLLEEELAAKKIDNCDVVKINGDMVKHEKFAFIRLFTGMLIMFGCNYGVLVSTSATNTGNEQSMTHR